MSRCSIDFKVDHINEIIVNQSWIKEFQKIQMKLQTYFIASCDLNRLNK